MLHFAFTGKYDLGTDKPCSAYSKCKAHAMNELYEAILKSVLPSFTNVGSDQSMVEKLQKFLGESLPSTSNASSASAPKKAAKRSVKVLFVLIALNGPLITNHS